MAFTQAQYDAMTAAISQGATRVKYADKEVEYRTLDEMIRIKGLMEGDLGINVSPLGNSRKIQTTYKSGLYPSSPNCNNDNW